MDMTNITTDSLAGVHHYQNLLSTLSTELTAFFDIDLSTYSTSLLLDRIAQAPDLRLSDDEEPDPQLLALIGSTYNRAILHHLGQVTLMNPYAIYTPSFDTTFIDFTRHGIVYEFVHGKRGGAAGRHCEPIVYVVYSTIKEDTKKRMLARQWMSRRLLGEYVIREWTSLPKVHSIRGGIGADIPAAQTHWHTYNMCMQQLRQSCLEAAQKVEVQVAAYEDRIQRQVSPASLFGAIRTQLDKCVEVHYKAQKAEMLEASKDSDAFMEEFMEFGE
ncbi:hypothetical protein ACN47E_004174 [Coniothyrium glycines]